jgi:hypothetical protein
MPVAKSKTSQPKPNPAKPAVVAVKKTPTAKFTTKPARPAKAKSVAIKEPAAPKAAKAPKPKKNRLVRDSFTIPKNEYEVLDTLKKRALKLGIQSKKSELLRAGIKALAALSDAPFADALNNVPTIKTGRPLKF